MIVMSASAIWLWPLISLFVATCAFLAGWWACAWHLGKVQARVSARYAPGPQPAPPLPRPGKFDIDAADATSLDIRRHWTALERYEAAETAPLSRAAIETSNWERNKKREMNAWMRKHGVPDAQRRPEITR